MSADTASNPTTHPLLQNTATALGSELFTKVVNSKLLLVGSGGIGCELLKNLALSGFQSVKVIDLDTIDVSNLNRQFLFRSHHVGKSKCEVASKVAEDMAPTKVSYEPFHGNVMQEQFNVSFFKGFDVVLNALDNVAARRHVNRLCLAANVPLVEAGTTGYLGQSTVIMKGETECYECQPKPTQKVYPICTIRSTPSMPVHCIVWAKELYSLMFSPEDKANNSMLYEDTSTDESTYMDIVVKEKPKDDAAANEYVQKAIEALYIEEINKQLNMDKYKTAQKVPTPLSKDDIEKGTLSDVFIPSSKPDYQTCVWSIEECCSEIVSCVQAMNKRDPLESTAVFDKDDLVAMRFVTAASNLRSYVFGIEPKNFHDCKGIAGNIIPAIATTNAIVAGLQVLEVFKILNNKSDIKSKCKYTYCLRDKTRKGLYLQPTTLPTPNPNCFVCRGAAVDLVIDCAAFTMADLIDRVLKKKLGFHEPSILLGDSQIWEEGEGADDVYEVNLEKTLENLPAGGVKDGTSIRVEDFSQDLEVDINITHHNEWDEKENPDMFLVGGADAIKKKSEGNKRGPPLSEGSVHGNAEKKARVEEDDDDILEIS